MLFIRTLPGTADSKRMHAHTFKQCLACLNFIELSGILLSCLISILGATDYIQFSTLLPLQGSLSQWQISLTLRDDARVELTESLTIDILVASAVNPLTIQPANTTIFIMDDDGRNIYRD